MRHAYLIIAHTDFHRLRRLVEYLDDEYNDIYVHIDASATGFDSASFEGACRSSRLVFIEPRLNVKWGGYSGIRAELSLLDRAVSTDSYGYLHLLSGSDLPIKSQEYIHNFFEANKGYEFVESHDVRGHTLMRCRYYTLFPEHSGFPPAQLANNIFKWFLRLLGLSVNKDVEFRCGANWFSITGGFASYVCSQKEWVEKTFRHGNMCDELFLQTLLHRSPFREKCAGRNMRYIDWSRRENGHRHPHTFTMEDYDSLKESDCLFARKFNERTDAEIMDRIKEIW